MKPSPVTWPELLQRKVYFCLTLIFYQENSGWAHWNKNIISYPAHHNDFSTLKNHPAVLFLSWFFVFIFMNKTTYMIFRCCKFWLQFFMLYYAALSSDFSSHKDIGSLLMYQEREGVITDNTTRSKDKSTHY